MRRATSIAAAAALTLGLVATAPGALARGGGDADDVRVAGTCSRASIAKLKLSPENGSVEIEFEVDQNRSGKRWGVVVTGNGTRVLARRAVTRVPSGSFEVRAVIAAGSPSTQVTAVARHLISGGEVCRAAATLS